MACRLIINADDFGWSAGVNQAICALYHEGVVTSASLMVGAPAAGEAVALARERSGLAVGLHLTLLRGQALLPRSEVPHLVDTRGCLPDSCLLAALRYTFLFACRAEMQQEAAAQFAAFAATGLPWSHVDSHLHFTITPVVFRTVLALCRQYPVRGFRVPQDDPGLYFRLNPLDAIRQIWLMTCFSLLCPWQRRAVREAALCSTRWCYGLFRTGRLDAGYLQRLVERMPEGDFELHCHPDFSTPHGRAEFEALRSPSFRGALERRGIVLSTYPELDPYGGGRAG